MSEEYWDQPIPDRVSLDPESPHFFHMWKKVGVKVDGRVVFTCFEFCKSERWVKMGILLPNRGWKKERGKVTTITATNVEIEPYWR